MLDTAMQFHSQFILYYEQYRDNNNFIRHNQFTYTIDRWTLAPEQYEAEFLDYTPYPTWIGDTFHWPLNSTRDGGLTWKVEEFHMVFGVYFFLSEDKVEQHKILANITEVIAIMEGVASLLFMFVAVIPKCINRKQLEAKTIRNCYFDIDNTVIINPNDMLPSKPMKFNWSDKIATYLRRMLRIVCRGRKDRKFLSFFNHSQQTYLRAYDHFRQELNLFHVLTTVHKLKACVQVLLNEDMDKLFEVKKLYFQHANIHQDRHQLKRESQIRQFLERDDKKLLYRNAYSNKRFKSDEQLIQMGIII